jgi:suppressor for copper-sensitivity B
VSRIPGLGPALGIALAVAAATFSPPAHAEVPREQRATLRLAADRTAYAPGETARISATVEVTPGWHLQAHVPTYDYLIPTTLALDTPAGWPAPQVAYPQPESYKFSFAEDELAVYAGTFRVAVELAVPEGTPDGPVTLHARLRYQACDDRQCLPPVTREADVALTVGAGGRPAAKAGGFAPAAGGGTSPAGGRGLIGFLLLGLVGGLILNAMPCVLPILSLKVFGLVRAAGRGRRAVTSGALTTAAGILVSFWALAGTAIAAKAAGAAVGWGIQFQRPGFVAFLAAVILLFTLNLWGLFEIQLPGRLASAVGEADHGGFAGHFASGLFATLMATPCSAPFLGTAVGFALTRRALEVLAVFTAIGLGMALPYLLLAAAPGTARFLPRPGNWMETLKGVMGFLLAGALVWLLYVLGNQIPVERLALVEGALLAVALLVWLASRSALGSLPRRGWMTAALAAAVASIALAGTSAAARPTGVLSAANPGSGGIAWRAWDPAEAERLAAAGTPVFLDVTADWCVTCKVNERLILETDEVRGALAAGHVVAMRGDWTNRNDRIGDFLAAHGRYGIPFYMLYRPGREPNVLPELLTRDLVVAAIRDAAKPVSPPRPPAE